MSEWIARYLKEEEPKSKSLIVTVFGDSIAPQSDGIWLSELIDLLAPLGINERLVRTSSFRLIEEDWFQARRDGRRSYYAFTPAGLRRVALADERIYAPPQAEWDGAWTIVMVPRNGETGLDRIELKKELEWEGFASLMPGVMLHPTIGAHGLMPILERLNLVGRVLVFRAGALKDFSAEPINALINRCWDLSDAQARYTQFLKRFSSLHDALDRIKIAPQQAFLIQTLLIHSFRRASLHDPRLPVSMLPGDWSGLNAYMLCRDIYIKTRLLARAHLSPRLPKVHQSGISAAALGIKAEQRFGGLPA